jgi:signal peptidase II
MTFAVAASVFIIDRLTKLIAAGAIPAGHSVAVIPGVFHLTLIENTGVAFGLLRGWKWLPVFVSAVAALAIVLYALRKKRVPLRTVTALGLVLGGALGNLADRVRFGYVIDFLDFRVWPVFNVADSCITAGVALLLLHMLRRNINGN